jgi:hypothetical protein
MTFELTIRVNGSSLFSYDCARSSTERGGTTP